MKTTIILLLSVIAAITSTAQIAKFHWLAGTWRLDGKNTYEVWTLNNSEQILYGKSYGIKGTDTVVTEEITLKFFDGSFHYIPDVAGDQPPVDFRITSSDDHSFVAENPQHDFPKIIRYRFFRKSDSDLIDAAIEGDGKMISYSFSRVK
jgi:hypothetical protein